MIADYLRRGNGARGWFLEHLESRIALASDTNDCLLAPSSATESARAVQAVNCLAIDLYQNFQREEGNLLFSPLSVATGLAMTYAGAAGSTADEMARVLHFGESPGIHSSFASLLSTISRAGGQGKPTTIESANSIWPDTSLKLRDEFAATIHDSYRGETRQLDYTDKESAKKSINDWVADKTHGNVKELLRTIAPGTINILINALYMNARWDAPFNPQYTVDSVFTRDDDTTVTVPMMVGQALGMDTTIDGFRVFEMLFSGRDTSLVIVVPRSKDTAHELTPETWAAIDKWLARPRTFFDFFEETDLRIPRFKTSVASNLDSLLAEMGMPTAFNPAVADFSEMSEDGGLALGQVRHKATIEVTETGMVAGAGTAVGLKVCFAAGTPVLTADGEMPIESVRAGDWVLARNENNVSGKIEPQLVEETFQDLSEVFEMTVRGETIKATQSHPFYVRGKGWTALSDLRPGDWLASDLSSWLQVERIVGTGQVVPVYNFRVAQHSTYFVGRASWGFAVWTHNACGGGIVADRTFHYFIRDNISSAVLFMGRVSDPLQADNEIEPHGSSELHEGDFDFDHDVDSEDLLSLVANWTGALVPYSGGKTRATGDLDGDADVDSDDLLTFMKNWTGTLSPGRQSVVQYVPPPPDSFDSARATELREQFPDVAATDVAATIESSAPQVVDSLFAQRALRRPIC